MPATSFPRTVVSTDGRLGIQLLEFEGVQKVLDRSAKGAWFTYRREPSGPESRVAVLFSRTVDAIWDASAQEFGLPIFESKDTRETVFAEAAIGEHLDQKGLPPHTPSGVDAFEIECFSYQFEEWKTRKRIGDTVLRRYIEAKLLWSWRYDELQTSLEFAEMVRLRAPMTAFQKVAVLGEGEDWVTAHQGPNHLHLKPSPALLRRLESGPLEPSRTSSKPASKPLPDAWGLLHADVRWAAQSRFETAHFGDAVAAAMKQVNSRVKRLVIDAGQAEADGKALMMKAFSVQNPIIKLADSSMESGRNIQEGFMFLFAGAMQAIRNPGAHENLDVTRDRALHELFVASLLLLALDNRPR